MPFVKSFDRDQLYMTSLEMQVDPDSLVRIIDAFVDSLDLTELGFTHTAPSSEGRPTYHPGSLLKLYIYGHRNNLRSSRRLAKACRINLEMKWLVKGAEPDFRTISDFRKDNHDKLKDVLMMFNKRFSDIMKGYASVDGTKIAACNSKNNNFTASKLDDRIKWLENHIDDYMRQMDQLDKAEGQEEDPKGVLTREQLEAKLKEARERLEKYQAYREYMEQNDLSQVSLTDVDSRLMKNRNGFTVSHNVQAAVDSETHMIRDFKVSSDPADYGKLEESLHDIKEQMPEQVLEAVADKGYQSEEDMARCLENGIIPNVIPPEGQDEFKISIPYEKAEDLHPESTDPSELSKCLHAGVVPDAYRDAITAVEIEEKEVPVKQDPEGISKSPFQDEEEMLAKAAEGFFVRDPEHNIVYCPAGETLRQNTVTRRDTIRYINKTACRHCPFRNQCHNTKKGFKEIEFRKDEFIKPNGIWIKASGGKPEFHKRRVEKEKRMMVTLTLRPDRKKTVNRMCLSEHPFGTIKRSQDSSYFLLRGNAKVTGEFALFSLAYNLQRAVNLLGFDEVLRRMKEYSSFIFSFLRGYRQNQCTKVSGNRSNNHKTESMFVCCTPGV